MLTDINSRQRILLFKDVCSRLLLYVSCSLFHVYRYSNTFLTNLLNRALLNDQLRRVQDNRGLDNISAASILAPGAFQGARNNSTMYWELERSNPVPTCTVRGDSDLGGPLEDWATSSVCVKTPPISLPY